MFGSILGKKKVKFGDLTIEELRREYRRLDVEEQVVAGQIRALEAQQARLFKRAVSSSNDSKADDRRIARKIHELRAKQNILESRAEAISQSLVALDSMIRMKEKQAALAKRGVWGKIREMDPDELRALLVAGNIDDHEEREMIAIINESLGVDEASLASSESPEVTAIREHIEAARESGRVEEEFASLDREAPLQVSGR